MQHLLANLDTGGLLMSHVAPLMDRLNALLGDDGSETAELRRRVRIVGLAQRTVALRHFKTVGTALVQRKRLRITYVAPEGGYTACALGASIFTEADTLAELRAAAQDAVR